MLKIRSRNYSFAILSEREQQEWRKNGKYHRNILPAVIEFGMDQFWFQNGKIEKHRYSEDEYEYHDLE